VSAAVYNLHDMQMLTFLMHYCSPSNLVTCAAPILTSALPTYGPTRGGTTVVLRGSNFGITPPSITFAGLPCINSVPFAVSPLHDTLSCVSPVGVGADLAVVVAVTGQSSAGRSSPTLWTYDPPVVLSISPASGPTAGAPLTNVTSDGINYSLGPPLIITVTGDNFGADASTGSLWLMQPLGSTLPDINVANSSILSWNHTAIVFLLPAGSGANLQVVAYVSGQSSADDPAAPAVFFSYDPPSVFSVLRYDVPQPQCAARPLCFSYGTSQACNLIPAGCYGTQVCACV
jgi:hypothetical protein